MISSFYIRNFRSILELTLDFSYAEGKAPNGYQESEILPFIDAAKNKRLVPCMAFFGANASGKTNLIKAFQTLKRLLMGDAELTELYEPNLLNPQFSDTTFAIKFFVQGDQFEYSLTFNANEINEESLLKNGEQIYAIKSLKGVFSPKILSANYTEEKLSDILRVECSDGDGHHTKSFLQRISSAYAGLHSDLKTAFIFFSERLRGYTNTSSFPLLPAVKFLSNALGGDEEVALQKITDVVRRLDIDIDAIDINLRELAPDEKSPFGMTKRDPKTGTKHLVQITTTHKNVLGETALMDFIKHESAGTQRLAGLVALILYSIETGGVLLIDELECSLHPLLLLEIVMLFKKRRRNPKNAQLIFTTHNTDILDDSILRISEIALVRKTLKNGTLVRRLVDIKNDGDDIRNVTNFRRQYLAGFYSSIPHPAL